MANYLEVIKTVAPWPGLIFASVASVLLAFVISGYVHSKPIGLQRLVDLVYADIAR